MDGGERVKERERDRKRCMLCQLECSEDDRRVCVCFLTGLDLPCEKNVCIGVSITTGWALPQGCRQRSVLSQHLSFNM